MKDYNIKIKKHGYKGKWLFQLYTAEKSALFEMECKKWFKEQPDPRPFLEYIEPCPCTSRQAWFDERFRPNLATRSSWNNERKPCATSEFASDDGWDQKCCYSHDHLQWGTLIIGYPGGGYAFRYKDNPNNRYTQCCIHSTLCKLFYQRLPSDDCKRYEPPEWSKFFFANIHLIAIRCLQ